MTTLILNAQLQEGMVILIVGLLIIFTSLLLLFVVFQYAVPALLTYVINRPAPKKEREQGDLQPSVHTGEEIAAIAAAIHAYLDEIHDEENPILTIHKSKKDYSPWSSKIYATHNLRKRRNWS